MALTSLDVRKPEIGQGSLDIVCGIVSCYGDGEQDYTHNNRNDECDQDVVLRLNSIRVPHVVDSLKKDGAGYRTRTRDPPITIPL